MEKSEIIKFLIDSKTLIFEDYLTKSGRLTPYYFNFGNINNGMNLSILGKIYAEYIHNMKSGLKSLNSLFGPSYKGIPIATATSLQYYNIFKENIPYTSNRKETKDRGEGGNLFGYQIKESDNIIIIEDVITSGSTFKEIVPMLRKIPNLNIEGIVVAVDRQERGIRELSALQEVEKDLKIKVYPIITISEIITYVSQTHEAAYKITPEILSKFKAYQKEYTCIPVPVQVAQKY